MNKKNTNQNLIMNSNLKSVVTTLLIGLFVVLVIIGGCMYLIPKYNVRQQKQAGKA